MSNSIGKREREAINFKNKKYKWQGRRGRISAYKKKKEEEALKSNVKMFDCLF